MYAFFQHKSGSFFFIWSVSILVEEFIPFTFIVIFLWVGKTQSSIAFLFAVLVIHYSPFFSYQRVQENILVKWGNCGLILLPFFRDQNHASFFSIYHIYIYHNYIYHIYDITYLISYIFTCHNYMSYLHNHICDYISIIYHNYMIHIYIIYNNYIIE